MGDVLFDGGAGNPVRWDLATPDGASITVWIDGTGPALVMVHGSIADHSTFRAFIAELRTHLTTFALDRRGFGATPDSDNYTIQADFADVAAVVDAVAERTGGRVALFGHSYGANCAMGGAARTGNVSHLILYEPSLGLPYPPGSIESVEAALDRGDNDAAIVAVLVGILQMTAPEVDALRADPLWPVRLAAAPTIPRECRVEQDWVYERGQFATITAPTVLLAGSESPAAIRECTDRAAEAIPASRILLLEGHGHFAHKTDPRLVAGILRDFLAG